MNDQNLKTRTEEQRRPFLRKESVLNLALPTVHKEEKQYFKSRFVNHDNKSRGLIM